jgi:hypothetical protein
VELKDPLEKEKVVGKINISFKAEFLENFTEDDIADALHQGKGGRGRGGAPGWSRSGREITRRCLEEGWRQKEEEGGGRGEETTEGWRGKEKCKKRRGKGRT